MFPACATEWRTVRIVSEQLVGISKEQIEKQFSHKFVVSQIKESEGNTYNYITWKWPPVFTVANDVDD